MPSVNAWINQRWVRLLPWRTLDFLAMVLAVLPVLLVLGLRPLVLIRFGYLISSRIGHFARNTEFYLCERDADMRAGRTLDVFFHPMPACNQQLKKMWDRTLHVSPLAKWPYRLLHRLPGLEDHLVRLPPDRDAKGVFPGTQAHLSFTSQEERLGRAALRELGIPEGAPFVCFHARDSAYLNSFDPSNDWSGHDYRDCAIDGYIPAVEELVRRGHFAIRMGAVVKDQLNVDNPKIIDYASCGRTDFLDIFLTTHCRFFLTSATGIDAVSTIFRRPVAYANFIPIEYAHTWGKDDLMIPKKLWLREERRFPTFREILDSGIGRFIDSEQYQQLGIDVIENDSEEITALAVEMDERLNGTWETSEEDEELQGRFWSLFKPSELHGTFVSRIGAEFLRQNRALLD